MVGVRLGEEQLRSRREAHTRGFGQHDWILADEIPVYRRVRAATSFARLEGEGRLGQRVELGGGESYRAVLLHLRHQFVRDGVKREDFLLADAEEVVVVAGALNDGL